MRRGAGSARAAGALGELERCAHAYGMRGLAARKRALVRRLAAAELPGSAALVRFHEVLQFLRAYPDDLGLHRACISALRAFGRRRDLARHAARLRNTGIAGTVTEFRFFARMAHWLVRRWPRNLRIDWRNAGDTALLEALLPLLVAPAEQPGLDEYDLGVRGWIERLRGRGETDAAFVVRSIAALPAGSALREALHDQLDLPFVLTPGPGTPARTLALAATTRGVHVQTQPLVRERPDLRVEALRAPRFVRPLRGPAAEAMIELARAAMVTRQRDLDAFADGDARDVTLVGFEDGLEFAAIGVAPERRLLLESVYGFLTLKNGVPIGYVLTAALFGSCELAYNVFDTYRGAEAARVYARVLAMARRLFGVDTFMIPPYQLGDGNDEAIESGAWWFYAKLGFEPRAPRVRALAARERARMERSSGYRSSATTLRRLAAEPLFFHLAAHRADVLGLLPLASLGVAATDRIARRFDGDRERAGVECEGEARQMLGVRSWRGWSAEERAAFARWAPLVTVLPRVIAWSAGDRAALADVVRAKGGRREAAFVRRFDAHRPLRRALVALARRVRV